MPTTSDPPRFHALVPCAGTGSRAGTAQPKQYQMVAGQAMVMHTVQALAQVPQLTSGWLVVSAGDEFAWPTSGWPEHFRRAPCGGATRAESVFNHCEILSSIAQRTVACGLCPGCWCGGLHHQRTQTLAGSAR